MTPYDTETWQIKVNIMLMARYFYHVLCSKFWLTYTHLICNMVFYVVIVEMVLPHSNLTHMNTLKSDVVKQDTTLNL